MNLGTSAAPPTSLLGWQPEIRPLEAAALAYLMLLVQEHRPPPLRRRAAAAPPTSLLGWRCARGPKCGYLLRGLELPVA